MGPVERETYTHKLLEKWIIRERERDLMWRSRLREVRNCAAGPPQMCHCQVNYNNVSIEEDAGPSRYFLLRDWSIEERDYSLVSSSICCLSTHNTH